MKLAVTLAMCFFLTPFAHGQLYSVTDLGPLSPVAINALGQVAGNLNNHAVIWSRILGTRDLGTLSGGTFSKAAAINDLGTVAGEADGPVAVTLMSPAGDLSQEVCPATQPFIRTIRRGMRGLGIMPVYSPEEYWYYWYRFGPCSFGIPQTYATGLNDMGQVVGSNDDYETYEDGFLWTAKTGIQTVIGPDDWQARVSAINNRGQLVGERGPYIASVDAYPHAAVWRNDIENDLGALGGADPSAPTSSLYCSEATSVNDRGQIVGWSTTTLGTYPWDSCTMSPIHAVSWTSDSSLQDLGTLAGDTSSMAYAVNLFGQIIGSSGDTLYGDSENQYKIAGRPFIWTQRSGMKDLNSLIRSNSGWVLNSAVAINMWGQIVGSGTRNGHIHGFLLTPSNPFLN